MNRMLALAVGIGLATVAGAQQKPDDTMGLVNRTQNTKGAPAALPVISKTQNARSTTIVYDVSGLQSWDGLYDTSNTIVTVAIPTGQVMTGVGYDVNLATVGGSYLSEARFYFDGSDRDGFGLFLTPGYLDSFPGTGSYSSGGIIDLTDNGIPDIPILADGLLYIELYEGFDDVADAVDADWIGPSTLTIVYDDPPAPRCNIWIEDFDSGTWPPTGWTVVDNTTNGSWNTSSFFSRGNIVLGGSGESASIDSDFYGSGVVIDGELWTDEFNVPAGTSLEFGMDYNDLGSSDFADVDISTDAGTTWTNLVQYTADTTGTESVDLSAYSGMDVIIRFHYTSGWDWWWQIDNVALVYNSSATFRNAGTNPASYTLSGPPILDDSFDAMIDVGSTGHAMGELFGYSAPLSLTLGGGQTVLIDFADPNGELLQLDPVAGPMATYTLAVPGDCALFGFSLSTQAVHFGGAPWVLSNAQDLVIGY